MPEQGRMSSPTISPLLKLGIGFAVIGVALIAAGIAETGGTLHGGTGTGVFALVAGIVSLALGGYLAWGYGWLKRRPELVKKTQQSAPDSQYEGTEEGHNNLSGRHTAVTTRLPVALVPYMAAAGIRR
jgi:hypothetical protein